MNTRRLKEWPFQRSVSITSTSVNTNTHAETKINNEISMSRLYNHEKLYVRVDFFFQLPHEVGSLLIKCYIIENVTIMSFWLDVYRPTLFFQSSDNPMGLGSNDLRLLMDGNHELLTNFDQADNDLVQLISK